MGTLNSVIRSSMYSGGVVVYQPPLRSPVCSGIPLAGLPAPFSRDAQTFDETSYLFLPYQIRLSLFLIMLALWEGFSSLVVGYLG